MAEQYLFETRGLTVGYHGQPLIHDITVSLPKGQILTLIGPNGAGKSTILKTISRQLSAIAGTVYLDGLSLNALPRSELARRLSVLLTDRVRPEMMTCFEVAAMGRYPHTGHFGHLNDHDRACVHHALRQVRADDLADREFSELSDGQRQRVLLARALCQEPEILILDEPTSFLDIRHKIDLLDILLKEARHSGLTVILSLHEIDLAEKISDLVMCVRGDSVWRIGKPESIFKDEIIAALYDIDRGLYLSRQGSVELSRPQGAPRIFVIGGGGFGIPHYRALARLRMPFAAGILFDNDLETDIARALAQTVITAPAFREIPPETVSQARDLLQTCPCVLDAGTPTETFNQANRELLRFAETHSIRIVRDTDELH